MKKMKKNITILAGLALMCCACSYVGKSTQDTPIPEYKGEAVDTSGFAQVFSYVREHSTDEIHSMVVLKNGGLLYEKYAEGQEPDYYHILWSASKTFTATAIGFAVQDGLLSVDDKVISFFDESELPTERSAELEILTVKHLLTMSAGLKEDKMGVTEAGMLDSPSVFLLSNGFRFAPGTEFHYNSMDTYMLSAIVTKVTGKTCEDYLDEKLFRPLGIRKHVWEKTAEGYSMGGWGLHLTTRSLAKAGQFFLQRGRWNGEQLLDEAWFDEAMKVQIGTEGKYPHIDRNLGYGYQMWPCKVPGAWRFDGAWGQYCFIFPDKNAVVAVNCHLKKVVEEVRDEIYRCVYSKL